MGDAAVDQQKSMQGAYKGFAKHISSTARDVNATWPIFRIPYFELHAAQVRLQSAVEFLSVQYMIEPKDREDYLKFVDENYQDSMKEGHMIHYGNTNSLTPIGYTPNFTIPGLNGVEPDYLLDRPIRSVSWQVSPRKFSDTCCWMYESMIIFYLTRHFSVCHSKHCTRIIVSILIPL